MGRRVMCFSTLLSGKRKKTSYWNAGGKGIFITHWLTKGKDTRVLEPSLVAHIYNLRTPEEEAGGSRAQDLLTT